MYLESAVQDLPTTSHRIRHGPLLESMTVTYELIRRNAILGQKLWSLLSLIRGALSLHQLILLDSCGLILRAIPNEHL